MKVLFLKGSAADCTALKLSEAVMLTRSVQVKFTAHKAKPLITSMQVTPSLCAFTGISFRTATLAEAAYQIPNGWYLKTLFTN